MKNLFTSLILLVGLNSLAQTDNCCINPEWINPNAICMMLWDPVIGCDAIEYSNSCVATAAGVTSWTYQSGAQAGMEWDCQNLGTLCTSLNGSAISEPGDWVNPSDPCDMGYCDPSGEFYGIIVDCAEQMGVPCNGEWVSIDGQCCSECQETSYGCESEGLLYEFGSSINQDCNTCYCQAGFNPNANGIWSCTEMDCGCAPISITVTNGWNMIGFACAEDIDAQVAFSSIQDKIVIAKDAQGNAYLPSFGFNGIGDLERGYGYLIKVSDEITNYNICD
jgi:hypothetical protein